MRNLEASLGVKLFVRHGPRLAITDQALALAEKVDEALATIQSALDQCRRIQPALRVTCAPTFALRWLVPRIEAYNGLPDSQPIALSATEELLSPDQFDIAIRSGQGPWRGCSSVELLPDHGTPMLSPALAAGAPMSPRRLLELPLIPDTRWMRWFELAGVPDATPKYVPTRFATYELEASAATKGIGVALLSPLLYGDLVANGALIAPFDHVVDGPARYWALWREAEAMPRFVHWMQREIARSSGLRKRRRNRSRDP